MPPTYTILTYQVSINEHLFDSLHKANVKKIDKLLKSNDNRVYLTNGTTDKIIKPIRLTNFHSSGVL